MGTVWPAMQRSVRGGNRTKPRWLWCSKQFCEQHSSLLGVLRTGSVVRHSVWRELRDKGAFATEASKNLTGPVRKRRNLQAIAIVVADQKNCFGEDAKFVVPVGDFIQKFANTDRAMAR